MESGDFVIKNVVFDVGGVLVAPVTSDWMLPPGSEDILGKAFFRERVEEFRSYKASALEFLPDGRKVSTAKEETELNFLYYKRILNEGMGLSLSDDSIMRIALLQANTDDRYSVFSDVHQYFKKFRAAYRIGILSDAPPSLRRILRSEGILSLTDASVFSCELGIMKPSQKMYNAILQKLNAKAEETVFIDDTPANLTGCEECGIIGVQMRRIMPYGFPEPKNWNGYAVRSLKEFFELCPNL